MSSWRLAIRELRRNPFRTTLIAAAVAIAAAALTGSAILITGANRSVRQTVGRLGADLMVIPAGENVATNFNEALVTGRPAAFYLDPATIGKVASARRVRSASPQTYLETLTNASCCAGKFFLVGFDPSTDFTITPWLTEGDLKGRPDQENWMVVGDRITLRVGDTARFYGTEFTVVGVLAPTGMGMDWTVYLPDKALRRMVANSGAKADMRLRIADGAASAVFIKADPGADVIDLAEQIEQNHPSVQAVLSSTVAGIARKHLGGVTLVLVCVITALWVMALVLSGVMFSQAVKERQGEIGLLMAKGATRGFVLGTLARETITVALIAAVFGSVVATGAVTVFREALADSLGTMDVLPTASAVVYFVVGFSMIVASSSVLASILPALGVSRMEPYEAIRRGKTA
ncbi:MAG: ABC transporter permease [Phycisphaerae bacterium]|jgi:putative ABC transport system permease protein|nr:ABC transporter permease [Phycisphaerae bacterium]